MNTIRIGFSKPRKWKPFAAAIMAGYGIGYSHVYIRLAAKKYDRDLIYQASHTMINFMSPIVFETENEIVREFELEVSDEKYIELMQFAIDNAGKPYGIKEALGLGIVRLAEIFGRKIRNPFSAGNSNYVCSVLADYVIDNFTKQKSPGEFTDASPRDIWNFLESISSRT